ncbi:16S rRNA (guanine(527)-N(7))-methyltransferase RsmG [Salirhabdus sp. Marseille-P4669]|uniref:16S rRNA (guanine(527)-N(7))-methyltransferase RsmG n=1 Tax=Salirhabdus sp. Marseille-P4669 TaxID=2042310 RepID=UPI000C7E48BD|nr:16S rRNA (guanine(527)-N(7))-methyltransferase RsmG [Salirhabdus sp. Marseille-P4669]
MNKDQFRDSLKEKGIELSEQQMNQFDTYYRVLVEWNEKMNLTAITDEQEVYLKHFYDSITAAFYVNFDQPLNVCDVGAGAGFPSLPLKIVYPSLKVTIVDSLNKRITFLNHLANQLGLENVEFIHDRAETFGKNKRYRETFDVVTARAVARMSVLSELCLPLVKVGGDMIALKAAQFKEEETDARKAVQLLGGQWEKVHTFYLPEEESERNIAIINKVKPTPKTYPRKPGTPNKSPIS